MRLLNRECGFPDVAQAVWSFTLLSPKRVRSFSTYMGRSDGAADSAKPRRNGLFKNDSGRPSGLSWTAVRCRTVPRHVEYQTSLFSNLNAPTPQKNNRLFITCH